MSVPAWPTGDPALDLLAGVTRQALRDATDPRVPATVRAEARSWCQVVCPQLLQRVDAGQRVAPGVRAQKRKDR